MTVNYTCKICQKAIAKNHRAIECDNCNLWVHIKCNKINLQTYKCLQYNYSTAWYCLNCFQQTIPFSNITNKELLEINQAKTLNSKL